MGRYSTPLRVSAEANFEDMSLDLYISDSHVKTFNLNKKQPGQFVGYFRYQYPNMKDKTKYNIVFEFENEAGSLKSHPTIDIYPKYGKGVINPEPVPVEVDGSLEQYYENHKNA